MITVALGVLDYESEGDGRKVDSYFFSNDDRLKNYVKNLDDVGKYDNTMNHSDHPFVIHVVRNNGGDIIAINIQEMISPNNDSEILKLSASVLDGDILSSYFSVYHVKFIKSQQLKPHQSP